MEKNDVAQFSLITFLKKAVNFYFILLNHLHQGLLNYWKYVVYNFVLFGLIAFYKVSGYNTYYEATSSYVHTDLPKKLFGDKLLDLDNLAHLKDYEGISNLLNIDSSTAQSIISIGGYNITGGLLYEDFSQLNVPFYVKIAVEEREILTDIQTSLNRYLEEDPFIEKHLERKKHALTDRKKELLRIVASIDTLINQTTVETPLNHIGEYIRLRKENYNEIYEINKKLDNLNGVELLKPFSPKKINGKEKSKQLIIKLSFLCIVTSLVTVLFLYWYKKP